jgi:hypothetical protein
VLITIDGGGSKGSRVRLWKLELQKLADETGLTFYPPGTSKWNRIELPHVLPQHPGLARQAARQPHHSRQSDRGHNHHDRFDGAVRTG